MLPIVKRLSKLHESLVNSYHYHLILDLQGDAKHFHLSTGQVYCSWTKNMVSILIHLSLNDKMHYSQKASEGALELRRTGGCPGMIIRLAECQNVGALRTYWYK